MDELQITSDKPSYLYKTYIIIVVKIDGLAIYLKFSFIFLHLFDNFDKKMQNQFTSFTFTID
ncbi:hypothetical protein N173_19945 [Acinetobacter baumannii EGD-HP18]|uniref:Uncharacterized protein n=1 Tax=Acinetobacter baumannii EGD-HP18 TaxID=1358412 RepID=A0AAV3JVE0_ACIBA|nr:hypothetical protein N173_19945 [Acinetobacter baumannii EGD-HP18]